MSPDPESQPGSDANQPLSPESWVASYGNYLFSFCMLRVGNREVAEDLVQDTFVSAMRAKDSFQGQASEKTWLTTILKNKIVDHYRRKDILKDAATYLEETQQAFSDSFFEPVTGHWRRDSAPAAWSDTADSGVHQAEFESILRGCIEKMPTRLARVFIAKFIDDEVSEIICKVHGLSTSNYWVILHRTKVLMRSCLEKSGYMARPQR
jgi:RNA polymerase sigma-70 factor (TIGR02943 family)